MKMGKNSFGNWDISFVGRSQLIWEIYSFNSPSFNLFLKYEIHRKINDWTRMLLRIFETTWTIQSGYAKEIDRVRESSMSDRDEYICMCSGWHWGPNDASPMNVCVCVRACEAHWQFSANDVVNKKSWANINCVGILTLVVSNGCDCNQFHWCPNWGLCTKNTGNLSALNHWPNES